MKTFSCSSAVASVKIVVTVSEMLLDVNIFLWDLFNYFYEKHNDWSHVKFRKQLLQVSARNACTLIPQCRFVFCLSHLKGWRILTYTLCETLRHQYGPVEILSCGIPERSDSVCFHLLKLSSLKVVLGLFAQSSERTTEKGTKRGTVAESQLVQVRQNCLTAVLFFSHLPSEQRLGCILV